MGLVLVMNQHSDDVLVLLKAGDIHGLQHVSEPDSLWPDGVSTTDQKWYGWFEGYYMHLWGNNVSTSNPILLLLAVKGVRIVDSFRYDQQIVGKYRKLTVLGSGTKG